jgi:GDPmannose 4,6-dehydratase
MMVRSGTVAVTPASPVRVALSFTQPAETLTGNMLETLRRLWGTVRFYNAGSSECFGDTGTGAANEQTAFRLAKAAYQS